MRRFPLPLLSVSLPLALAGCPGDDKPSDTGGTDVDADTDADADTDTDTDTDADTDTDTDVDYASFAGSVTIQMSVDGATVCDADIDLTGPAYTGTCDGCDFAFEIDATVTRDEGTDDCYLYPQLSYLELGVYKNLLLAHADEYTFTYTYYDYGYGYYYYDYDYSDVFMTGFSQDWSDYGYGYYPGPYWWRLSYDGANYGSFEQSDNTIEWSWSRSGGYYDVTYYVDYGSDRWTYGGCDSTFVAGSSVGGAEYGTGVLGCSYYGYGYGYQADYMDIWTFDGAYGEVATVSVDTVSDATAFDPWVMVSDGDQCILGFENDTIDCSYPPPENQCPSMQLTLRDETYTVFVAGLECQDSGGAEYKVAIDAGFTANLAQLYDDADLAWSYYYGDYHTWELTAEGSGTLSE